MTAITTIEEGSAAECETPIDRLRKIMRRFQARDTARDTGPWRGLSEIKQAHGGTKEQVRGLLIKLVATGEVEVCEFANGVAWCAKRPERVVPVAKPAGPKLFVLQREICERGHSRSLWFDAESFETEDAANAALKWQRWAEQARIDGRGGTSYTMERAQRMRVVKL